MLMISNAKTYNIFYAGMRQMMAEKTGFFGDSEDKATPTDYLMNTFIKNGKHDGITHIGGHATNSKIKHRVWITLKSNQIKAVENRGTFINKTNDMFKSKYTLPKRIKK